MTQITHSQTLPKNIDYWDYYILCRCDDAASKVLQRMEYWDGTKACGNIHNEKDNDQAIVAGKTPMQDTSRYIYKTREELAWEMIGAVKERSAYVALDDIIKLHYLKSRHNPYKTFDRTLQYEFQFDLVQNHLNQLYAIIQCFSAHGRQQRPILYAIEQLVEKDVYINRCQKKDGTLDGKDTLTIALVAEQLSLMHSQMHQDEEEGKKKPIEGQKKYKPLLPTFIKQDLKKDELQEFSSDFPLCKNAQCIHTFLHNAFGRNCTMECADLHDALCAKTQAIPMTTITVTTNSNYKTVNEDDVITDTAHADVSTSHEPLSENKAVEETKVPETERQVEVDTKPPVKETARPSKTSNAGKKRQSKKDEIQALLAMSEIAAPKKPDLSSPYTVELLMRLADYYRGSELTVSTDPRSRYQKALKAAMSYIQRRIPVGHIDKLFCFMLGRGEEIGFPDLKDTKWIEGGYNTDLWTIEPNHASKWLECQRIEQQLRGRSGGSPVPEANTTQMTHDEAVQLAADVLAQSTKQGYEVQAKAASLDSGWAVYVTWITGKQAKLTITSRSQWDEEFVGLIAMTKAVMRTRGAK